jgi:hypothetical protein
VEIQLQNARGSEARKVVNTGGNTLRRDLYRTGLKFVERTKSIVYVEEEEEIGDAGSELKMLSTSSPLRMARMERSVSES